MHLIVGATGWLGGEICRRLRDQGKPVRAFVRKSSDTAKITRLKGMGAEIVVGDLQDRESLDRACAGARAVISTASSTISRQPHDSLEKTDLQGQLNLIEAATRARVGQFVLISFSGKLEGDTTLHRAKRSAERALRESGLTYTILRPSCFMEVWLSPILGFDPKHRVARIFGSGERPVSFISLYDVAEFAVQVLDNPAAKNQVIELGGPEALTPREVVKIFEEELRAKFNVHMIPEEELRKQFAEATEEYQKTFAGLSLGLCGGDAIDMTETVKKFPIKLTSVRDYAKKAGFVTTSAS